MSAAPSVLCGFWRHHVDLATVFNLVVGLGLAPLLFGSVTV